MMKKGSLLTSPSGASRGQVGVVQILAMLEQEPFPNLPSFVSTMLGSKYD
jgi:hypothetical protein